MTPGSWPTARRRCRLQARLNRLVRSCWSRPGTSVIVAMVCRCGGANGVTVREGKRGMAGCRAQDTLPLAEIAGAAGDLGRCHGGSVRAGSSALVGWHGSVSSPYDMVRQLERCRNRPSMTSACRTCCCCWPPMWRRSVYEGTHVDRQRRELERHRRAGRLGLRRRGRSAGRDHSARPTTYQPWPPSADPSRATVRNAPSEEWCDRQYGGSDCSR